MENEKYRFIPRIISYANKEITPMEATAPQQSPCGRLVWAILSKDCNGRSEVIKVTTHEDADQTIKEYPGRYWKSGPIVLPLWAE